MTDTNLLRKIIEKKETGDFREFLMSEVRYASLTRSFPDHAESLFRQAAADTQERYRLYQRMAAQES